MQRNLVTMVHHHVEVLVLGAGMAGLACASRLFEHKHYREKDRLLILEGRDRIGGRINSVHINSSRLDTGANWIHGVGTKDKPNPLMGIIPDKRLKDLTGTVIFQADDSVSADSDALSEDWVKVDAVKSISASSKFSEDLVVPASVAGLVMSSLWSMLDSLHEHSKTIPASEAKGATMLKAISESKELQQAFKDVPALYKRTLGAMPQFIEGMEAAPLVAQSAETPKGQAGMSLLEFAIDDFGGDQVFVQDGYTRLTDHVAADLTAADKIQLGEEVLSIDTSGKHVTVTTTKGAYTAEHVVCTLPLGVLQHSSDTNTEDRLFWPPLPPEKREAIESLGFGTLDKIMLVYSDAWWTEESWTSIWKHGFVYDGPLDSDFEDIRHKEKPQSSPDFFMGFTDELPGLEVHEDGTTSSCKRLISIVNLHNLTDFPVLSSFVSCAPAAQVEAMTDEQAGGIVHRALTKWLGREPPGPVAIHVSRWKQDRFSRGSYSHMITGLSENKHREAFQRPIINSSGAVLSFAGEHTSQNHFATVHGALLSGWREADAVLNHPRTPDG